MCWVLSTNIWRELGSGKRDRYTLACFTCDVSHAAPLMSFVLTEQMLYLMDIVKNGIQRQNQRVPFVLTSYIAKVAHQMLRPGLYQTVLIWFLIFTNWTTFLVADVCSCRLSCFTEDHMYVVLNKFLLSQQSLDLKRVPEFFKLFYSFDLEVKYKYDKYCWFKHYLFSSDMFKMKVSHVCVTFYCLQHKMEREWILNVLGEGINDDHCFELCNQQGIFQSLLGFGSSPLCDETFQVHSWKCTSSSFWLWWAGNFSKKHEKCVETPQQLRLCNSLCCGKILPYTED